MNIETLSATELVNFAADKGLSKAICGMTYEGVRDFLIENEKTEELTAIEETQDVLSWQDLKKLAKEKGINTYKKKRAEIEILLKGEPPEEPVKEEEYPSSISEEAVEKAVESGDLVEKSKQATEVTKRSGATFVSSEESIMEILRTYTNLAKSISETNQRIDRIVDAISKSKRVKGL